MSDLHYNFSTDSKVIVKKYIELSTNNIDAVILAGDIININEPRVWDEVLSIIKYKFKDLPIYMVFGNHDFWDKYVEYSNVCNQQSKMIKKYNINCVENSFFCFENILITGYNGWYAFSNPPSNDKYFMPKLINDVPFNDYLRYISEKQLDIIISKLHQYEKVIIATHFEPNGHQMGASLNDIDKIIKAMNKTKVTLCCGHTHKRNLITDGNFRLINSGGDYESPDSCIFEF